MDLLFYPIDTLKTRLQSAQGFSKAGGLSGIYKGVGSVIVGSAPGGEFLIFTESEMEKLIQFQLSDQPLLSSQHMIPLSGLFPSKET